MIQPEKLFSTPLWHIKAEDGDKKSIDELYKWVLDYQDDEGVTKSNRGGGQSSDSDNFDAIPHIDLLKKKLYHLGCGLKLQNWWVNVNKKGDYNERHTHPGSDLSLVWYFTDNNNSIQFFNQLNHTRHSLPQSLHLDFNFNNVYNWECAAGDILIFPADVPHQVNTHNEDNLRICLAANLQIVHDNVLGIWEIT